MSKKFRTAVCLAAIVSVTGCATTSPMLQPSIVMAQRYDEPTSASAAAVAPDWWQRFGSPELQSLVDAALAGSPDLAMAMERVRQAEAQVAIAGASLFPTLDLGFGTSRKASGGDAGSRTTDASSTTLSVSYEVDVWGRNAAGVRGANDALRGSMYDRDAARLTLVSGVATGYFQLLSLRSRLALARDSLEIAERVQALVATRARNGVATQLDVERQDATVLAQRAALLPLERQERQTLAALAVLIGRTPQGFDVAAAEIDTLQVPVIDPGLPAELLVRRPDIASAEARLAGANADLGAARAALLPRIQLTGAAGVSSAALMTIVGGPGSAVSLALSVLQPIFDGGRLRGQVRVAESVERELVESYRKTILTALGEVESALVAASRVAQQETLQAEVLAKARNAQRLAEVRYREGADDLLTVLDAQRSLFDAQDRLAQLRLERLEAAIDLSKALGGGWHAGDADLAVAKS
jgi:NodT family efflux transporter outer membrane factor (OMF) lipoprotein